MMPHDKVTPGYWYVKWVKQKDNDEYSIVEVSWDSFSLNTKLIVEVTGSEIQYELTNFIFLAPVPLWYN